MTWICPNVLSFNKASLATLSRICTPVIFWLGLSVQPVWANSITTIDFRDGVTEEKVTAYHKAVFGELERESSSKLIRLLVSADKGFDAGWLQVPKQRRVLRVNVVIYLFRGDTVTAPIRVNLYELDQQSIKHLNLEASLR